MALPDPEAQPVPADAGLSPADVVGNFFTHLLDGDTRSFVITNRRTPAGDLLTDPRRNFLLEDDSAMPHSDRFLDGSYQTFIGDIDATVSSLSRKDQATLRRLNGAYLEAYRRSINAESTQRRQVLCQFILDKGIFDNLVGLGYTPEELRT